MREDVKTYQVRFFCVHSLDQIKFSHLGESVRQQDLEAAGKKKAGHVWHRNMICKKIHLSIFSSPFAHTHKGWSHLADPNISLASKLSVYREKEKPLPGNGIPSPRRYHYSQHTSGQHCLLWSKGVATAMTLCDHAPWYWQCSRACFATQKIWEFKI